MIAGVPAAAINSWLDIPTIVLLPISGMAYAVTYAALVLLFRLLSKDELESLKRILYVWNRRSALNTEKSAIG
jgi:type IV secretory pathway VirB3-like protein